MEDGEAADYSHLMTERKLWSMPTAWAKENGVFFGIQPKDFGSFNFVKSQANPILLDVRKVWNRQWTRRGWTRREWV